MIEVHRKTMVLFSDVGCPWAHAAVHRWRRERAERGLDGTVHLELRAFPLEVFNRRPTPKHILEAEIPVAGLLAPDAGWQRWQGPPHAYPVTTLPAIEAVHAARDQGQAAAEELDSALRRAFFGESRCISMRHEILDVAEACPEVDAQRLVKDLDEGRFRPAIFEDFEIAQSETVNGSPHFFLPDGSDFHNPGIELHWEGESGHKHPVIDKDDPAVYGEMFDRLRL